MPPKEVMRTEDVGSISFIESVLVAEKINYFIADYNFALGWVGVLPVRIMISESDFERAKELLISAGFKKEIYPLKKIQPPL